MPTQIKSYIKDRSSQTLVALIVIVVIATAKVGTPFMALAAFSYGLLCLGILNVKSRKLHGNLMMTAITLDVSLVIFLQLTRNAIETTFLGDLSYLEYGHIASSTLATLCYFPLLILGNLLLHNKIKEKHKYATLHKRVGITAFILRSLGFLLMYSLIK